MAVTGLLSYGTKFQYAVYSSGTAGTKVEVKNLQSVPSLGGDVDKVETTCLENSNKTYINGLKDYGDMEFKFLYAVDESVASTNYAQFAGDNGINGKLCEFTVTTPDGSTFVFDGTAQASLDAVEVNQPLTFTVSIALASDIEATIGTTPIVTPL